MQPQNSPEQLNLLDPTICPRQISIATPDGPTWVDLKAEVGDLWAVFQYQRLAPVRVDTLRPYLEGWTEILASDS
jgi:hypothetical protein